MRLDEVKVGMRVKVKKIHAVGATKKKLMDMGLIKNTEVFVRKVAPLGDPIELTLRGYELTIRKEDAMTVEVE